VNQNEKEADAGRSLPGATQKMCTLAKIRDEE